MADYKDLATNLVARGFGCIHGKETDGTTFERDSLNSRDLNDTK